MARQTRAQRRARREAREQQAGSPPRRPAPSAENGGAVAERRPEPRAHVQRQRVPFRFVRESWGELQKVEWPNQNQLIQGVVVVVVACIIVGVYLWLADLAFRRLVQHVFL